MKVVNEVRAERNDVFSFWEERKVLNENNEAVVEDVKIEETTEVKIKEKIVELNEQITAIQDRVSVEGNKLNLIYETTNTTTR